ncbi:probable E3 ubiquitin-protein ligase XERICO isoform X2 [Cornus florida]|nr:probable E3 ubiquitin-protein ligase XERICO isoform X2 [Cornus florida]
MGLSNYPTPTDGGMFIVILVNAALSIYVVKDIFLSILHVVGIHIASAEEPSIESMNSTEDRGSPSDAYVESFRSGNPVVRFDKRYWPKQEECSVCLTEFEPETEIHQLPCGHIFHKLCLEKWLKYWKVTCPNCRTLVVGEEDICPF